MEWTERERHAVSQDEVKEAIGSILEKAMVCNGKINLDMMEKTQIDYAIYLLREYRVLRR